MKAFALPLLATLACLPCVITIGAVAVAGLGVTLVAGLVALPVAIAAVLISALLIVRRRRASCSTTLSAGSASDDE